jgi:hypothetical protein
MKDETPRDPRLTATSSGAPATRRVRYHAARLQTSPQFTAVLDVLFELPPRTQPAFAELIFTDEGLLFARAASERDFRYYCGPRRELLDNLRGMCRHFGFGAQEQDYVFERLAGIPLADIRP